MSEFEKKTREQIEAEILEGRTTDPRFRDRLGDRLDAILPETVKKLALAGMGAVFMTEEGIRNAVSDLKLPREAVSGLLAQTEKARMELFRMIASELRMFLDEANFAGEIRKILNGITVDVQASISFRQTEDGSLKTDMKAALTEKKKAKSRPRKKTAVKKKAASKKNIQAK